MTPQRPARLPSLARNITAPQGFALVVGLFYAVRSLTTLFSSPSFQLPGDGWRGLLQLLVAIALLGTLNRPPAVARAVIAVGVVFAAETVLGLVNGHDVLGVIPIDGRDKIIHPLVAVLALVAARSDQRRRRP